MATHELPSQTRLTLGPGDQGRLVTAEEFATADYLEPWKYERVEGRLRVMAPEGQPHVSAANPWRDRLVAYKLQHADRVDDVVTGAWVRVLGGTDRIGDIGVYLVSDDPPLPIPDRVPELMYEVVSPGQESHDRDYIHKRDDYHRLGVREYVIVDRFARKVTVLTHDPAGYQQQVLAPSDTYTSPLLPGLAIALAEVMGP